MGIALHIYNLCKRRNRIMPTELKSRISLAAKWSAFGEILAKLVTPISTVVLARVLTPEAFGVIATITMVISFAEVFMDAGFQRYVIQKEYDTEQEKFNCANVAFWTNLVIGLFLWLIIFIYRNPIARIVGNPGLGIVLAVAAISIPISAITSIQMAIFKHSLDFKSLFYRRLASVIVPLVITIPLALWLRSYWALVWGTIAANIVNAVILSFFSPWRPRLYYNYNILKGMLGYSSWTLLDAILIWATSYIEIFFIGVLLSDYYLGLYKTAMTTVNQFVSLISAIIIPVLMPAMSRTQHDFAQMREIILKMQRYLGLFILPLGGLIFAFRSQITSILLGSQWTAISLFIGIWALSEVITLLFARFCSNIYPSIGKPHISVIVQVLHLVVLIPAVYIAAKISFETLYWTRTIVRFELLALNLFFAYKLIKFSPWKSFTNVLPFIITTTLVIVFAIGMLRLWSSDWSILVWGPICLLIYFGILYIWPGEKSFLCAVLTHTKTQFKHRKNG